MLRRCGGSWPAPWRSISRDLRAAAGAPSPPELAFATGKPGHRKGSTGPPCPASGGTTADRTGELATTLRACFAQRYGLGGGGNFTTAERGKKVPPSALHRAARPVVDRARRAVYCARNLAYSTRNRPVRGTRSGRGSAVFTSSRPSSSTRRCASRRTPHPAPLGLDRRGWRNLRGREPLLSTMRVRCPLDSMRSGEMRRLAGKGRGIR